MAGRARTDGACWESPPVLEEGVKCATAKENIMGDPRTSPKGGSATVGQASASEVTITVGEGALYLFHPGDPVFFSGVGGGFGKGMYEVGKVISNTSITLTNLRWYHVIWWALRHPIRAWRFYVRY